MRGYGGTRQCGCSGAARGLLSGEAEGVLPHTLRPKELHHSSHLDAVAARDRVRSPQHLAQPWTHIPLRPHAPEEGPAKSPLCVTNSSKRSTDDAHPPGPRRYTRTLLGLLRRWGWDSLVLGLLDVAKRVCPRNIRHGWPPARARFGTTVRRRSAESGPARRRPACWAHSGSGGWTRPAAG
jgi:hypothetical protein